MKSLSLSLVVAALAAAQAPSPESATTVHVINNNWLDMHMYAIVGGQVRSLGVVGSFSNTTFELPTAVLALGQVRILGDPIGAPGAYLSDAILVSAGDQVEVTIEGNLGLSSYSVTP